MKKYFISYYSDDSHIPTMFPGVSPRFHFGYRVIDEHPLTWTQYKTISIIYWKELTEEEIAVYESVGKQ